MTQGLLGALPVGGVLRVGDGESLEAPVVQGSAQILKRAVRRQRRAVRHDEGEAAEQIVLAAVAGEPVAGQRRHVAGIGGEKYIVGGAFADLARQVARRSE